MTQVTSDLTPDSLTCGHLSVCLDILLVSFKVINTSDLCHVITAAACHVIVIATCDQLYLRWPLTVFVCLTKSTQLETYVTVQ